MNPHQKNKIDIKSLSPEEQRLFRLYGKLPSRSDHFAKHLKERKYFDSGDYALSKAGKADSVDTGSVGSQHPVPENIPHLSSPISGVAGNNHFIHGKPGQQQQQQQQGTLHHPPHPGAIPGANIQQAGSPIKEGSVLQKEAMNADDVEEAEGTTEK